MRHGMGPGRPVLRVGPPVKLFDQVKSLVSSGDLQITYIDHLPRTISHALKRSLFEIFDGQVDEPFFELHKKGREEDFSGFDRAAQIILAEYARRRAQQPVKKPVTILIKDVARSVPGRHWNEWTRLSAL